MKLSIVAVAFFLITSVAMADGMAETNPTTDSMSASVNAGAGENWLCSDLQFFSCVDTDHFVCYGWDNCAALGAIPVAFLTTADGADTFTPASLAAPVATPEPSSLVLLVSGLAALLLRRR
jgi:hypothetical protein